MMGSKNKNDREIINNFSLEQLVPQNHLVRKIDKAIDFSFIRDRVKHLYSKQGTISIDPVVLFKIIFIQYIFGIRSMRQTIKEIEVNIAYRWFLGYGISDKIPHFSTFSKNYERRFKGTPIFEEIFYEIIYEISKCNFLNLESVFIDGTHIKANANTKRFKSSFVFNDGSKFYQEELNNEIALDRENHKKKELKSKKIIKVRLKKTSTTDPQSGLFNKGEHKKVFAYSANVACDKNNFILDYVVTSGNTHDSTVFPKLYERLKRTNYNFKYVVVDAGYKIPAIAKLIIDDNKVPVMPYKRPMTKDGFFKKYEYVYDEYFDCCICPKTQVLKYTTTNRDGYKQYKSDKNICKNCQDKIKCTNSKNNTKIVTRHIWENYMELVEDIRHSNGMKQLYSLRSQTIERVFADAKEKHAMRYTNYRGLAKVTMELTLKFACMNLKKLATWKWKNSNSSLFFYFFEKIYKNLFKFENNYKYFLKIIKKS